MMMEMWRFIPPGEIFLPESNAGGNYDQGNKTFYFPVIVMTCFSSYSTLRKPREFSFLAYEKFQGWANDAIEWLIFKKKLHDYISGFFSFFISEKERNRQIFTTFLLYKSWKTIRNQCILYHHLLFVIIIYRVNVLEMWRFITPSKIIFPSGVDLRNTILLGEYIFIFP